MTTVGVDVERVGDPARWCRRDLPLAKLASRLQIVSFAAMPALPTAQHDFFDRQATPSRKGLSSTGVHVFPPSSLTSLPAGPTATAVLASLESRPRCSGTHPAGRR